MSDLFRQAVLDLPVRSVTGRSDFFTAPENSQAIALIDSVPNGFHGAVLVGEKGCGKTHLAHLFAAAVFQKTGRKAAVMPAADFNPLSLMDFLEESPYIVLENVSQPVDEQGLFHLLNAVKSLNGFVLLTAERRPAAWGLTLPDLMTRLKALPCVEIQPPGEMLMQAVLIKQFSDRQLKVAPEVIAYILRNMERSFSAASFIVKRADELSLERKNGVTIPLIRQVLSEKKG
ncbi:MAG: hypothetical protein IJY17_07720 [Alphaproteobacteria bacterium]|nr:hypothetical protein [Alphaproteobacteria bacterium]